MGQLQKVWQTLNRNTRRRKEKGTEEIVKVVMTGNFPKLMTNTKPEGQAAQRTPSRINTKISTSRDIIHNCRKPKTRYLKELGQGWAVNILPIEKKVKNYFGLLFRSYTSKKSGGQYF